MISPAFGSLLLATLMFAPAPADEDAMDGVWIAIAGEEKGIVLSKDDLTKDPMTLKIKGNQLTMITRNETVEFSIVVSAKEKPSRIDFVYPKDKGTNHAIYSLVDGKLTICMSSKMNPNTEEDRPEAFTTHRSDNKNLRGLLMFVFERKRD